MDGVHVNVDQWDVQATIQRLNDSLIARGYVTWFDLKDMKVSGAWLYRLHLSSSRTTLDLDFSELTMAIPASVAHKLRVAQSKL